MKKRIHIATVFLSLTALSFLSKSEGDFKNLYALEGTWKMSMKKGTLCEEWKKVDKNYLQSRGYIVKGNDTIVNERVALTNKADAIYYTSTVEDQNNKQPVAFKMTKSNKSMFVFENPEHDFPKRIVYHIITSDSLHAWIDDGVDGSKKRQDFFYKKQK